MKGFELETTIYPVDGLSIDGSLSYINVNYDERRRSLRRACNGQRDASRTRPTGPTASASSTMPMSGRARSASGSTARIGRRSSPTPTNSSWSRIDGRFLGNARISYTTADEDWEVALEVQNVFDKYYFLSA